MNNSPQTSATPKQRHGLFEFVIGFIVCVGIPAIMTGMAPVSWIEMNRIDNRVVAKTQTCVFFFFPYSTRQLDDVKKISTTFRLGDFIHRRGVNNNRKRAESEGGVIFHGPADANGEEPKIGVSVSPASLKAVEETINEYLKDPQQKTMKQFVVANWKVGIIFAVPVCLLTVLFVVGWSVWLGQTLARPFQFAKSNGDEATQDDVQS